MTEPSKEAMAEKLWRLFDAANEVKLVMSKPSGGTFRLLHNDECIVIMEALQLVASSALDQVRAEERERAAGIAMSHHGSGGTLKDVTCEMIATAIRSRKP